MGGSQPQYDRGVVNVVVRWQKMTRAKGTELPLAFDQRQPFLYERIDPTDEVTRVHDIKRNNYGDVQDSNKGCGSNRHAYGVGRSRL